MHLKGYRFGFPLVWRLSLLKHHETYRVAWHRHAGIEIQYVLKGDISWELKDRSQPLAVSGGFFSIVPAGVEHRALDNNGAPAVRLGVIFEKDPTAFTDGLPFTREDLNRIFALLRENGGMVRRFTTRLTKALREFVENLSIQNALEDDGRLHLRVLLARLVYETYATLGEPEVLAEGRDVIPQIRAWIEEHYAQKITVPQLVGLSGYGRSRFFALFLAETGMTPNDYLVRVRVEKAKEMLSQKDDEGSILDLAVACGFGSAAVFSATFRKYVGLSPRAFKDAVS